MSNELDPLLFDPSVAPHFLIGQIRAIVDPESYSTPEKMVNRIREKLAEYDTAKKMRLENK
jgi:hypothetical protein